MPKPAIPTMSLGRPQVHPLTEKLTQASHHGFEGIELFYDDLVQLAQCQFKGDLPSAAHYIHQKCAELNLHIICLQPFTFYEGLLDRTEHDNLLTKKLPLWFELARILDTNLIQLPANFLGPDPETGQPRTTGDMDVIVSDLQELADKGLEHADKDLGLGNIRFVYEALAWSNHVDTWEKSWDVVRRVDRPNFGICLDTFNIAGRVYADPAHPSGKRTPGADEDLEASIRRLRDAMPEIREKLFYVQIVDGERLWLPLDEKHPYYVPGQPARMSWSRNARLFAFEEDRGGYLPVLDLAKVILGREGGDDGNDEGGFEGWVSLELFSRTLADPDSKTPRDHALRGRVSWKKLVKALGLNYSVDHSDDSNDESGDQ